MASATVEHSLFVWGGSGPLTASEDPNDLTVFKDGAVFDLEIGTWSTIAPAPIAPRSSADTATSGSAVLVYGGSSPAKPTPDSSDAIYNIDRDEWHLIDTVPDRSVVVGFGDSFVALGPEGAWTLKQPSTSWEQTHTAPERFGNPDVAVVDVTTGRVVVLVGAQTFEYSPGSGFSNAADSPLQSPTYGGGSDDVAYVWDEAGAQAGRFDWNTREWAVISAPGIGTREGSAVCLTSAGLAVWGGWSIRETAVVAQNDGKILLETDRRYDS